MIDLKQESTAGLIAEVERVSDVAKSTVYPDWSRNYMRLAGRHEEELNEIFTAQRKHYLRTNKAITPKKTYAAILNVTHRRHMAYLSRQMDALRKFQVVPATNEATDRGRAKGCERMLLNRMSEYGGPDTWEHLKNLAAVRCCDKAFMFVEGDPTLDRPIVTESGSKVRRGEVLVRSINGWDVAWLPGVFYIADSPVVVTHERLTQNEADRRWGKLPKDKVETEAKWHDQSPFQQIESNINEGLVSVKRLWILPSKDFPQGAQRILRGENTVLKTVKAGQEKKYKGKDEKKIPPEDEWIGTPDNRIPLVEFRAIPVAPTSVGNGGLMRASGTLQNVLNLAWSKLVALMTDTPGDILTFPPHGEVDADDIANSLGLLPLAMQKLGGQGLEYIGGPALEPYLKIVQFCMGALDDIFGQPASSRGQIPGTRTAGRTLQVAASLSAQVDAPEELIIRLSGINVQRRILIEGREVWPDEFVYNAIGHNHRWERGEFKKADIPAGVDVRIRRDEPLPKDPASLLRWGTEMYKAGAWGAVEDPAARRKFLDTVNLPSEDEGFLHDEVQKQLVRKEMAELRRTAVPVNLEDDDEMHMQEHNLGIAEELGQDKAPLDYRKRTAAHQLLHQQNIMRKEAFGKMQLPSEIPEPELTLEMVAEEQNRIIDLAAQAQQEQQKVAAMTEELQALAGGGAPGPASPEAGIPGIPEEVPGQIKGGF